MMAQTPEHKSSVLLISPISGVVGGILCWTKTIVSYYEQVYDSKIELSVFDFARKRSGQLSGNILKKAVGALVDYFFLTKGALCEIKKSSADVVHISSPGNFLLIKDVILSSMAKRYGKKVIMHFHFGKIPEVLSDFGWERLLLKAVLRRADRCVVMDNRSYEALVLHGFNHVVNVPNPISSTVADNVDMSARLPNSVLFVGHVLPTKGVKELVHACASLKSVKLKIVGCVAAEYQKELLSIANELHYSDLCFLGEISHQDVVRQMSQCAVFVLPSYTEGFPNVVLESMACSCAIVATSVGAIPQMLNVETPGKECGIVVPPKDVEQLSKSISRMLTDTEFADNCRKNARERLLENYTVPKVWDQLEIMWRNAIFAS